MPLHFGGMSDPFQPLEIIHRASFKVLEFLASINYPVLISTKSNIITKKEYLELLKGYQNLVVQFSFSTLNDRKAEILEKGCPRPSVRLKSIEKLCDLDINTQIRWQPYIPLYSENPQTFISKIRDIPIKHMIVEFLKIPIDNKFNDSHPLFNDKELINYYIRNGSSIIGREIVLNAELKMQIINEIKELLGATNISLGAADNDLHHFSSTECCCGIDRIRGFENWNRYQVSFAVKNCRNGSISYDTISDQWRPKGSIDKFLNSKSRIKNATHMNTVEDYILERWEDIGSKFNPSKYFGVTYKEETDSSGRKVFLLTET